ncbi:MAG: hypothetical protein HW412_2522, partial [Bacteroidetes bacterium]|nr:hypothetical protein [Bacteroidota bacterium]
NAEDLDPQTQDISVASLSTRDLSCNWSKFANPEDVRFIENGKQTDGCYSFSVETSRYRNFATPVHDPLPHKIYENYSHVEIRELDPGEDILFEPPKERHKKTRRKLRFEYRQNIVNNKNIELDFSA